MMVKVNLLKQGPINVPVNSSWFSMITKASLSISVLDYLLLQLIINIYSKKWNSSLIESIILFIQSIIAQYFNQSTELVLLYLCFLFTVGAMLV